MVKDRKRRHSKCLSNRRKFGALDSSFPMLNIGHGTGIESDLDGKILRLDIELFAQLADARANILLLAHVRHSTQNLWFPQF